jgi:hypothetical protein
VRPANVVVGARGAVLVDWGIARPLGMPLKQCGVAAFCDARVWAGGGVTARPHHDALAALYTWLAVAFGGGCAAPWLCGGARGDGDDGAARREWVAARAARDARVARVARGIDALECMTGRSRPAEALAAARDGLGLEPL